MRAGASHSTSTAFAAARAVAAIIVVFSILKDSVGFVNFNRFNFALNNILIANGTVTVALSTDLLNNDS